jgi:hypothetical protein
MRVQVQHSKLIYEFKDDMNQKISRSYGCEEIVLPQGVRMFSGRKGEDT